MPKAHTGTWSYHCDDCRCGWYDMHCNRDGWCWSCCGSCQKDSYCSGDALHPTHWKHPEAGKTHAGSEGVWPVHKDKDELNELFPGTFDEENEATREP